MATFSQFSTELKKLNFKNFYNKTLQYEYFVKNEKTARASRE